jgi:hypothetical protein
MGFLDLYPKKKFPDFVLIVGGEKKIKSQNLLEKHTTIQHRQKQKIK